MPATPNPRVVYAKLPGDGLPIAGEHVVLEPSHTLDLDAVPLNGGFLTKTLLLSPEPFMRERMRDPSVPSYSTAAILGAPVVGFGLVVVLRSEKEGIKAGDHMFGMTTWEAYTLQPYVEGRVNYNQEDWPPFTYDMDSLVLQVVPDPCGAFPWTRYCSVLGTPGLTAFCGFEAYADAKEGETIFISSGASGVGSILIQLAKAKGLKVIASAGSDAKLEYMHSLGADVAFNYNTTTYAAALREHGPIDLYWDNVGGEALEAAIECAGLQGRIICCGSSADYNLPIEKRYGIKNTTCIFKKRLNIRGFLTPDLLPQFAEKFFSEVPALLAQGKITSREHVIEGIENAPEVFVEMFKGGNDLIGKLVILVAKE